MLKDEDIMVVVAEVMLKDEDMVVVAEVMLKDEDMWWLLKSC